MPEDRLREALEALRAEVGRLEGLDEPARERLGRLLDDIESKAQQPPDAAQHTHLIERLKDGVAQFEVSHPTLTLALNEVLGALSGAGV